MVDTQQVQDGRVDIVDEYRAGGPLLLGRLRLQGAAIGIDNVTAEAIRLVGRA